MTQTQIAAITAAVIAALGQTATAPRKDYGKVQKRKAYKAKSKVEPLDPKADRQLQRLSRIAAGFKRRGIDVSFNKDTGRFDNVRPYKLWIVDGRRVRKGERGVLGFFHISQTDVDVAPAMPSTEGVVVTTLPVTAPELGAKPADKPVLSENSVLIPA